MTTTLVLGLALFIACWVIHVAIWRIRRPAAYPVWLFGTFLVLPPVGGLVILLSGHTSTLAGIGDQVLLAALLLHIALSLSYISGYAGIIEYSPSAEILRAVHGHMPQGVPLDTLSVDSLTDEFLVGKRISHLKTSRLVRADGNELRLTAAGELVVAACQAYRAVFGISGYGKG